MNNPISRILSITWLYVAPNEEMRNSYKNFDRETAKEETTWETQV
jgi:hypothetical protein